MNRFTHYKQKIARLTGTNISSGSVTQDKLKRNAKKYHDAGRVFEN